MTADLRVLYQHLDERLGSIGDGHVERLLYPESSIDLFAVASSSEHRWSLELRCDPADLKGVKLPLATKGIGLTTLPQRATLPNALAVRCTDPTALDLFAALATDVASAAAKASSNREAADAITARFARWRALLQSAPDGLDPARQRGLYAELWLLRDHLISRLGRYEALAAWRGPLKGHRDFEAKGVAFEVKSSAANEPQVAIVNGERQLDDAGFRALYLVHASLEVMYGSGETLPGMVESLREAYQGTSSELDFEDLLLAAGYVDAHENRYRRHGYLLRDATTLHVRHGFPRLVESELPDGIGGVRYTLAIAACRDYEVTTEQALNTLGDEGH